MAEVLFNALNPTNDINTYVNLANQAGDLNPILFYQKQLLDTIRIDANQFVYYRLAETMPIGEKADKLVLKRYGALEGHTVPLVEGNPPQSDKGAMERYELQAYQYGRYMEFSDKVDFQVVDPVISHYTQEYSIVAMETLDKLARNALMAIGQVFYAGSRVAPAAQSSALGSSTATPHAINVGHLFENLALGDTNSKPNMTDLRMIVLTMKKQLVKPRMNNRFQVLAGPEFYYDMISDATVEKFMQYNQSTGTMYEKSALVPMFEMEFYETLICPNRTSFVSGGTEYTRMYMLDVATYKYASVATSSVYTIASGYSNYTFPDTGFAKASSYIPNKVTFTGGSYSVGGKTGPWKELKVMDVMVIGKEALIRTGLSGEDSAKMYVKQKGSSGVLDPIDQRQSIGFKINSVGFGNVRSQAVAHYLCIPTQLNT